MHLNYQPPNYPATRPARRLPLRILFANFQICPENVLFGFP